MDGREGWEEWRDGWEGGMEGWKDHPLHKHSKGNGYPLLVVLIKVTMSESPCWAISHKGLFTYYVIQKWGGPDPPSPLFQKNQKLASFPSPLVRIHILTHSN